MSTPKAFMSYSWDSEEHKAWVKDLAARLRGDGVDVTLDLWEVALGDQLTLFMEKAVRDNDFVLIICTPKYRERSDERVGGVGYEGAIMTGEVFAYQNHRKFVPILRAGTWDASIPSWLKAKYSVDLSMNPYRQDQYSRLRDHLHGMQEQAPPIGPRPIKTGGLTVRAEGTFTPPPSPVNDPIKIVEIITTEVGTPRNDGTPGSALYKVPLRLSRRPSPEWARLFVQTWDSPPSFTPKHRPGIARVQGDRVILDGTTVEEVETVHRETLKVVVEKVNREIAKLEERKRRAAEREAEQAARHKQDVEDAAKRISFD